MTASRRTQIPMDLSGQFLGIEHENLLGPEHENHNDGSGINEETNSPISRLRNELMGALDQSEARHQNQINEMREDRVNSNRLTKADCLESYAFSVITHGLKLNGCTAHPVDLNPLKQQIEKLRTVIAEFKESMQSGNRTAIQTKSNELDSANKTCEEKVRAIYDRYYQIAQEHSKMKIYGNLSFEALGMQMEAQAENQLIEKYPNFLSRTWHRARGEKTILLATAKNELFQKFVDDVVQQAFDKIDLLNFFREETPLMAVSIRVIS